MLAYSFRHIENRKRYNSSQTARVETYAHIGRYSQKEKKNRHLIYLLRAPFHRLQLQPHPINRLTRNRPTHDNFLLRVRQLHLKASHKSRH
jgi:hypothetical protein